MQIWLFENAYWVMRFNIDLFRGKNSNIWNGTRMLEILIGSLNVRRLWRASDWRAKTCHFKFNIIFGQLSFGVPTLLLSNIVVVLYNYSALFTSVPELILYNFSCHCLFITYLFLLYFNSTIDWQPSIVLK